jgi:hypothetical protein
MPLRERHESRWVAALTMTTTMLAACGDEATSLKDNPGLALVVVFLLIGAAYVAADVFVDWLEERFLILSGVEYLLLGFGLGVALPGVREVASLQPIFPVIALTTGWLGLLRGTELRIREVRGAPEGLGTAMILHLAVPGLLVGLVAYFGFQVNGMIAALLGCVAAAHSSEPFAVLSARYQVFGPIASIVEKASRLGDVLVILAFGLVFCVFHEGTPGAPTLNWWQWTEVTLVLGLGLGLLMRPFVAEGQSTHARFLALVGIIFFASGAAYFLALSALLVNLVLGIVLVNLSAAGQGVRGTLRDTERPMTIVLFVIAGALVRPAPWLPVLVGFLAFVVLRALGSLVASRLTSFRTELRSDLHRGFVAQSAVVVAMAVTFRIVVEGELVDVAYIVILLSVIFHGLLGPRLLRGLLMESGGLMVRDDAEPPLGPSPGPEAAEVT